MNLNFCLDKGHFITEVGKITKKEIPDACPDISKTTVERTLTELVKSGYIAKVGSGPATGYVRI